MNDLHYLCSGKRKKIGGIKSLLKMKNSHRFLPLTALLICALIVACGHKGSDLSDFNKKLYSPAHASGYEILGAEGSNSSLIVTHTPWQGSDSTNKSLFFIARDGEEAPAGFRGQVLRGEPERIVCMSSTHIGMLDALGKADRIVGVSGLQFTGNATVVSGADRGNVKDIGYDSNIDYESLISLAPDLVILYGVNGANAIESKLRELGIPFIYLGEYLEESPLGKAEWLVPVAEVLGMREEGARRIAGISERYEAMRNMIDRNGPAPKVMLNTPWGDSWMMPSTNSYVSQLVSDAGGYYIYRDNQSRESRPIDMEEAYRLTMDADIWLNTGQAKSISELANQWPKFSDTKPMKTGQVWNNIRNKGKVGYPQYWESGCLNPDLVLRDLIKIFHPELMEDQPFTFYERLQ